MALLVWKASPTLGGRGKLVFGLTVVLKRGLGVGDSLGDGCGASLGNWLEKKLNLYLDIMILSRTNPNSDLVQ